MDQEVGDPSDLWISVAPLIVFGDYYFEFLEGPFFLIYLKI